MSQVTCSLCNEKFEELKWIDHQVSTNHSQLRKNDKDKNAKKFLKTILNTFFNKNKIYDIKIKKILYFCQSKIAKKPPKERFDMLCSDSISN